MRKDKILMDKNKQLIKITAQLAEKGHNIPLEIAEEAETVLKEIQNKKNNLECHYVTIKRDDEKEQNEETEKKHTEEATVIHEQIFSITEKLLFLMETPLSSISEFLNKRKEITEGTEQLMILTTILVEHHNKTLDTFGLAQKADNILKQLIPKPVEKQNNNEEQHDEKLKKKSINEMNNTELLQWIEKLKTEQKIEKQVLEDEMRYNLTLQDEQNGKFDWIHELWVQALTGNQAHYNNPNYAN